MIKENYNIFMIKENYKIYIILWVGPSCVETHTSNYVCDNASYWEARAWPLVHVIPKHEPASLEFHLLQNYPTFRTVCRKLLSIGLW